MEKTHKIILFALILGTFMTALDATIVSVALPDMAKELGEAGHNISNISWVLLIYTLMLCCFILLWSKIGSNIGYKKVFMSGVGVFAGSSLVIGLIGFCPQIGLGIIILMRAVQGLGAGMCMAVSLAMVSAYLPKDVRGAAIGAVTLAASAGTAFGPAIGGVLTTFHWSYIFFINVPIGLFCILLCWKYMKIEEIKSEKKKLDVVGALLLFLMLFTLIMYLNRGKDIGWMSETGIAMIAVTCIFGGLVAWWEARNRDPLINLRLIHDKQVNRANIIGLLMFAAMAGCYLLLPYYFSLVLGMETIEYGFLLIANSLGMMVAGPIVGRIADKTGDNKIFVVIGCIVTALGYFLMMRFDVSTSIAFIVVALFVMGAGVGMAAVASTNLAFQYIRPGEDGQLSGLINTYRQAGTSAGVAIMEAIFTAVIAGVVVSDLSGLIPGFRASFFLAIIMSLVALMLAFTLKNKGSSDEVTEEA